MAALHVDVCVVGGGPAGSAVALHLGRLGRTVAIIEARGARNPLVGQSLAPSVLPLLGALGIREDVEGAGFLRPDGTVLYWGGTAEWRKASSEPGFHVDRSRFDTLMLTAARAAGACVMQPARLLSARHEEGAWRVRVCSEGGALDLSSRILVDAAGRRSSLPHRRRRSSPATIALTGHWRDVPLPPSCAHVEACTRQWYWGAPLADGSFAAAVFLDAGDYRRRLHAAGGRDACYDRLLVESRLLRACLRGRRISAVHAGDATPYVNASPADAVMISVGEAAFAIDPLSSQGVQAALGSALHASAVVNTVLERPDDAELACEFYRRAQNRAVEFHRDAAGESYAAAAVAHASSFWQRRAACRGAPSRLAPLRPSPPPAADAFVQLSDEVRIESAPILSGDVVVRGRQVVLPLASAPIAFLGEVELAPLLDAAREPIASRTLRQAWGLAMASGRADAIFGWLWSHGVLRASEG